MEIETREADPYNEIQVIKEMVKKGRNTVIAHMKHLKDHGEFAFLKQAVGYLMDNAGSIDFPAREVIQEVHLYKPGENKHEPAQVNKSTDHATANLKLGLEHHLKDAPVAAFPSGGGCPGSRSMSFTARPTNGTHGEEGNNPDKEMVPDGNNSGTGENHGTGSRLTHWPVQMHLINPHAAHFRESDLLLAADCVAYSAGNFHNGFLRGKTLAIACPKLDTNKEVYLEKLVHLINEARINTLTVMKMEVPCCSGIEQIAMAAVKSAERKVPVKSITIGVNGEMLSEEWL